MDQPFGAGWDRFWLGWLYSKLSNYGQSFWRPMSWLVALWLIFACLYAYAGEREPPTPGVETGGPTNGPPRVGSWAYPLFAVGQAAKDGLACQPSYEDARTRDAKREKVTDPKTGEEVKDARGEAKTKLVPAQNFQPTNVGWEAAILSARNATLFDRSDLSRRMYGCLYGIQERTHPVIPPSVTLLQTLQTVLSGILLFLAGLAIRNMYRVK